MVRLGKWMRRPLLSWENYRLLFNVAFWLMLTITYLGYVIVLLDQYPELSDRYDMRLFGLLPVTLAFVVLGLAWSLLPWRPGASRRRLLAVPFFLAAVFWANYAMVGLDRVFYWPFFLIAFGHGVFLFGPKRSLLYAGLILALILAYLLLTDDAGLLSHVFLLVAISPTVLFVIASCAAILEATRRRGEAQELLEELESAHAELRDYAGTVRELSVSEERTRMAREFHDSLGHYLTAIKVQLEAADRLLHDRPEEAQGRVRRSKSLASEALGEVRRSVRALKPLSVEERSGTGALRALVRSFDGAGPRVAFEVAGEEHELPPEAELVLYRALQEGLTNAFKHSGAGRIEATVAFEPGRVRLRVADNGKGVPEGTTRDGFGLPALRQRAAALGGDLRAGNVTGDTPSGGFVLEIELPVGTASAGAT